MMHLVLLNYYTLNDSSLPCWENKNKLSEPFQHYFFNHENEVNQIN